MLLVMEQQDIQNNIIEEQEMNEMLGQDDLNALVDYFRLLLEIDQRQKGEGNDESNEESNIRSANSSN